MLMSLFLVLLCFGDFENYDSCEEFDGTTSTSLDYKTVEDHRYACLGEYDGLAVTIGGYGGAPGAQRSVEILGSIGWYSSTSHPQ